MPDMQSKPKIAVYKFTSCDGCQLSFLNLGPDLLTLIQRLDIVHFIEAGFDDPRTPVDLTFVEGSISIPSDIERIHQVRKNTRVLITLGACATSGGIQALRNYADAKQWVSAIYANESTLSYLATSKPISEYVKVDYEVWGCPVSSQQVLNCVDSYLKGVTPHREAGESVCQDCKRSGYACVMVTQNMNCLGPVTHAGCGALCPQQARACYGCYGPKQLKNIPSLKRQFESNGDDSERASQRLHFIYQHHEI